MFKEVSKTLNISDKEEQVLRYWQENDIFHKTLELRKDRKPFVFYEGPPTANGKPGIHHVMSRTVKDVVCRYKTMKGYLVNRKAGWDTHGLPVEIEVEKMLGLNGKDDIEKYGIDKFNKKCRESVFNYKKEWDNLTQRIGYWLDLENPYITFTNEYIESIWWILKELWNKDLIYRGFKILPYCPRCETPLSSHEVSQGYKDVRDPSVYVKAKKKNTDNTYFLVWTTTPWTLISNVALAVNPEMDYVEVKDEDGIFILAKERISDLFRENEYQIIRTFKGSELEGLEYERLFDFVPVDKKAFYVITGDFVTADDGTGIVHIAPAFGEDDYQIGRMYDLPVIRPVNKSGKFEDVVTDYKNQFVKDADENIVRDLRERGILVKKQKIEHSYPHCWRCDTPLLYYARESWYIATTKYKDRLLANNAEINWHPSEVGTGRFNEWLKNNIDWSLSRDRYWGTPLNIWICSHCDHKVSIGSIEELKEKGMNVAADIDLHKPFVDDIIVKCEKCNNDMHRVPEVIDCWFDSGSMPYAQFHYPFEHKETFKNNFPCDFICEGIDQTRGWFYSLLAISTLLFDTSSYKNIVVNELILDKDGQKMSKRLGNIVVPEEMIKKYGADTIRWYLMTVSPPWLPKRFDEDGVKEVLRKFINTLINTYSFFVMYANIDKYSGEEEIIAFEKRPEIDRWILSRLYSLIEEVNSNMENYNLTRAARIISDYVVDDVSNWYVRRNRRRFWKSGDWTDKFAAYQTLHEVLLTLSRLTAPFAPFLCDDIYLNLAGNGAVSVHLCDYPELTDLQQKRRDKKLENKMQLVQKIVSIAHSLRNESKIRVRQPLANIRIFLKDQQEKTSVKEMESIICDEINVKEIKFVNSVDELVEKNAKPNFKNLGPKVGKLMGKIAPVIKEFKYEQINNFEKKGFERIVVEGDEIKLTAEDVEITSSAKEGLASYSDNYLTIAIDLKMNQELLDEGIAREIINRIQNLRKESDFAVTDRISIFYNTGSDKIKRAVKDKSEYIKNETLATKISTDIPEGAKLETVTIDKDAINIGLNLES